MEKEFTNLVAEKPQNESREDLGEISQAELVSHIDEATEKKSEVPADIQEWLDTVDDTVSNMKEGEPKRSVKRAMLSVTGGVMLLVATMTPQKAEAFDFVKIIEQAGNKIVKQVTNDVVNMAEKEVKEILSGKDRKKSEQPEQPKKQQEEDMEEGR